MNKFVMRSEDTQKTLIFHPALHFQQLLSDLGTGHQFEK